MKKYTFNSTRLFLLIIRGALSLIFSFLMMIFLSNFHTIDKNFYIFIILLILLVSFKLLKIISQVNIQIKFVNNTCIEICRNNLFYNQCKSINISNIKSFLLEDGNGYKIFKIKGAENIKMLIDDNDLNMKNFNTFYNIFEKEIEKINLVSNSVIKEKTVFENNWGFFYGVLILSMLILIPILYFICNLNMNIGYLLIIYPSSIVFLWRLYLGHKCKNKQ